MLSNIFLLVIFISLSAFFSASETAIFSLSNLKLKKLQELHLRGKIIKGLLDKPTRTLSTVTFGNMLVNVGISSLFTTIFVDIFGDKGVFLAILTSGIFILLLGEVFPKTFAIYLAENLSLICAPILSAFSKIFFIFIFIIEKIALFFLTFILRLPQKQSPGYEELKTALVISRNEGQISAEEKEMISHVLEFKDTWVSEIMSPRVDIHGIDAKLTQGEVLKIAREESHSRFPVYENSFDNIVGILSSKDLFLQSTIDYHLLLKPPFFIPETKRIDDLLKLFLENNEKIAIVLDEYGGTQGLVTLEDIQEEIFGEIYDEFEVPHEYIEKIDVKTYRLYGKTPIKVLNLKLDLNLPEEQDTIAGFILFQMGKIPQAGEKLLFNSLEFTIEKASAKMIVSLILKIK